MPGPKGMENSQLAYLSEVKAFIYLCPRMCCLDVVPQADNNSSTTNLGF